GAAPAVVAARVAGVVTRRLQALAPAAVAGAGAGGGARARGPREVRQTASAARGVGRGGGGGGGGRGGGVNAAALAALSPERRAEYDKRLADVQAKHPPPPRAPAKAFVNHIDYLVKKIGIDHVGISSDFDGGGGIEGWNSPAESFNVTLELVRRGYTEEQIAKLWSGNLLR